MVEWPAGYGFVKEQADFATVWSDRPVAMAGAG